MKRGKNRAGHQQYYCNHCHRWFVETSNTPLYRKQLSESEIISICKHLVEKNGIRSIERITGHHRDTIGRLLKGMAEHVEQMKEYPIEKLSFTPFECDEIWSVVKKQKKVAETAKLGLMKTMHGSSYGFGNHAEAIRERMV